MQNNIKLINIFIISVSEGKKEAERDRKHTKNYSGRKPSKNGEETGIPDPASSNSRNSY